MSVTNYTPDKCKYSIGKLVKSVWLVSEEAIKDIRIDNGEAWVESVSETPIRLDCYSIELTDTDTLDERYKFTHTLTFSVNGYANKDDFQDRYYAIVKDDEGTYWLVNPLFPCKVTYTYTLGNEQNHTDFTMSTASNHPVLKLNGMVDSSTYECNEYWLDGIDALWLNEKRYTVHSGNHVMYTNGGFKTVEYNSKSATFTETFDGTNTSHGIEFDVLFSEYKKSWHYNLLEFKDNLYASVIKTRNNKYALCGFSLGMQPGFQVSANDTNNQIDRIHITLNDAHDAGDPIEMYDSIEYEYLSAKTWVYTDEYDGWECVDEGVARYLLQMEIDALENETGNYKALDGYASRFPYLHIVDTFDNTETFSNVDCGSSSCRLRSSFPSQLTFNDTGCQTYYVKADSDWEIDSSVDYIRVSPSTGSAGESYIVSVCNDIEPSDTVRNSSLTIDYCNTSSTVDVSVEQYEGCFTQGSTYNIPANAKVMTLPSDCCINSARETTYVGVNIAVYQDYLQVTIPENNTSAQRTIILLVTYCDGTTEDIIINQSDVFEKWELYGETFCVGTDLYGNEYLYTGTTPSSYVRTDTSREVLIERFYYDCLDIRRKWEETSDTLCVWSGGDTYRWVESGWTCVGYDKYVSNIKQVSHDGGITWENTTETSASTLIESNSQDCGYVPPTPDPMYRWINLDPSTEYYCSGTTKMYKQQKQISYDNGSTWENVVPAEYQQGSIVQVESSDCGYVPPSYNTQYLTIVGKSGSSTIQLPSATGEYQYSLDEGNTWEEGDSATTIALTDGGRIMYKGTLLPIQLATGIGNFVQSGNQQFEVEGNPMSLLFGDNFITATTVPEYAFESLFDGCSNLISAENLALPPTVLTQSCYSFMFHGCRSLTSAPALPATTLANNCYYDMFSGCTSLTTAPELPAATLVYQCYYGMFNGCTKLNSITCLATSGMGGGVGVGYSTSWWVQGVSSSGTFTKKAGITWPSPGYDYSSIPTGWTVEEI